METTDNGARLARTVAGDLNCGVATNVFDAINMLQVIVGLVEPTAAQGMLGDPPAKAPSTRSTQ